MSSEQRQKAIGEYHILAQEVKNLGYRAGSHLHDLRDAIDVLSIDDDFTTIDFDKVKSLIDALEGIKKSFEIKVEKMNRLKETYGL